MPLIERNEEERKSRSERREKNKALNSGHTAFKVLVGHP